MAFVRSGEPPGPSLEDCRRNPGDSMVERGKTACYISLLKTLLARSGCVALESGGWVFGPTTR